MFKKIIWALLEVATIGYGTYVFVSTMVNEDYVDHEVAGIGASLIAAGLLLRNWRVTLFIREERKEAIKVTKYETQNKTGNTLLILILALSFFALNRKINDTKLDMASNELELQNLNSGMNDFGDLQDKLDNVESLEERIEDLEIYSRNHY